MARALILASLAAILGCSGASRPPPLTAPDPYEDYVVEEHSITAPPAWTPGASPKLGRLWRFDLDRGNTRNGAGFTVIARDTPGGGRVVAFEFDGTLILGETRYEAEGFGSVALVAFGADGQLLWTRKLDRGKYHYVKALEVMDDGDIVVGGAFGKRGLSLARISPAGEERWILEPGNEPPWSEVSSLAMDPDGNIVAAGIFQTRLELPGVAALSGRYFDGFLIKVAAETGKILWTQQMRSPEAKASAVHVGEAGDLFVTGDFKRELRVDRRTVRGGQDFFVARFSPAGALHQVKAVAVGWPGRVQRVQPLAGGRFALHVQGEGDRSALIGINEADGRVAWTVSDSAAGAVLATDSRARPDTALYGVHDTEPSYGSPTIRLREISAEGATTTTSFLAAGPYLFITHGQIRRLADGGALVTGSLRDQHWDNDGFYPFLVDIAALAPDMSLADMLVIGRGTGTRCREVLPRRQIWRDARAAVSYKLGELRACGARLSDVGARLQIQPSGQVTHVTVEGRATPEQGQCLGEALSNLRLCPFEGEAHEQRLERLD